MYLNMAAASLRAFLVPTIAQIASVHSLIFMLRFGGLGAVNSAKEVGDPPLDFILSLLGTDKLEDKSELSSNESLNNKKNSKTYRQKSTNFFDFSFIFVDVLFMFALAQLGCALSMLSWLNLLAEPDHIEAQRLSSSLR